MSTVREVRLMCDGPGCSRQSVAGPNVGYVRRNPFNRDWVRRGGEDFCPTCAANLDLQRVAAGRVSARR